LERTRSTQRTLHKEENQVRGRKVVVREVMEGGDHGRSVARLHTPQDPVVDVNSLGNCLHDHKIKGVKGLEYCFWGVRQGVH
jgi:hypothetical protein